MQALFWALETWCVCEQSLSCVQNAVDYSPPGSSTHGIFQVRILEWIAIPFSRGPSLGPSQPRNWTQVSCTASRFFAIWATREALQPTSSIPGKEINARIFTRPAPSYSCLYRASFQLAFQSCVPVPKPVHHPGPSPPPLSTKPSGWSPPSDGTQLA